MPVAGGLFGSVSETADAFASLLLPALALALAALVPVRGGASRGQLLAGLALLLLGGSAIGLELAARPFPSVAPARGSQLVVVTHNVAVANVAPEATRDALLAADADVILLQEVNGRFAPMLPQLHARYRWSNACTRGCSLAILSRWPLDRVRYRLHDGAGRAFGPPLLATILHLPGAAPTPLLTLHLPWPLPAGSQERERAALVGAVAAISPARVILTGDFNLTPWGRAMRVLDGGLAPLARITRALPTFPARVHGVSVAPAVLPIDHIFVGPAWQVVSVNTLPRTGSDHLAVRAVLTALPPAG